jgi:hypothetical protein
MTDTQFIALLSTAIGSFVLVILSWINQNQRLSDLRSDMRSGLGDLGGRIDSRLDQLDRRLVLIEGDQKQFFAITGKLEGRIEELHRK